MALLEKISAMKQSGMPESKIAASLMEEGYSPREVSEALSQSKIKSAVAQESQSDMQPSIATEADSQSEYSSVPNYGQSQSVEAPEQSQYPQYQQQYQEQSQQTYNQNAAYQQQYPQEQGNYYQQAIDLETVRDIARQQVEESLKKLREQVDSLVKAKTETNFHVQDMENRLQRVESVIQDVQRAIIKKMGEYGDAISGISNEIKATQQSFAKLINPILDNKRGIPSKQEQQSENNQPQQKFKQPQQSQKQNQNQERPRPNQKNSAGFEDYFR